MTVNGPLVVEQLTVEFIHDGYAIRPLDDMSFSVEPGEIAVLLGPSGSGKTTLLSCLGGILTPTSGSIRLGDIDVSSLPPGDLGEYRRTTVGFVFQAFNLIASLNARENVAMPMLLNGVARKDAFARADELLTDVGLAERAKHRPAMLSGGQQQRVAVARGLGQHPPLLLADEPTASLDHIQAEGIIRLLRKLRDAGRVIVVSTHDARLVPIADKIVKMVPDEEHGGTHVTGELSLAAGASVFEQGDRAEVVYTITSGEIAIVRVLADGGERELARLGPGRYFGELGPFLGFPRSASARAVTDVVLEAHPPTVFRERLLRPD
ncbi:MAG: ATP-binding cassette domain-containing protein [Actinomycetota bacterium]